MKIKHLGFMEKHVEKFILGGFVLLALLVYLLLAAGEPHSVALKPGGPKYKPGEVEPMVLAEAKRLESLVNRQESPLPEIIVPDYQRLFRERLDQPLIINEDGSVVTAYPIPLSRAGLERRLLPEPPRAKPYFVPTPPAPTLAAVSADFGVLSADMDESLRSMFEPYVGDRNPPDVRFVVATGEFDMAAWAATLAAGATDPASQDTIPEDWWRDLLLLTSVYLERQTLGADGSWSEPVDVPSTPGSLTHRGLTGTFIQSEAAELIRAFRLQQARIAEHTIPLVSGEQELLLPTGADQQRTERIAELQREIEQLESQVQPGREQGPDFAGGRFQQQRTQQQQRLLDLRRELNELLGFSGTGAGPEPTGRARGVGIEPAGPEQPQLGAKVKLRTFDLTVEPGATYRYRLRVEVASPLFFRTQIQIPEQREAYFHKHSLTSAATDWSQPVRVDREREFFFVAANPPNVATFEVWTIFNGKRRSESFEVRPGDVIGGSVELRDGASSATLDLAVGMTVVDVDVPAAGRSNSSALLINARTGELSRRQLAEDRDSPRRTNLQQGNNAPSASRATTGSNPAPSPGSPSGL